MQSPDEHDGADEYSPIWVLIAQTRDALLKARDRDYSQFGLTNERRAILYIIEKYGGKATPTEIARNLFRELHSVTEMLGRMEEDGLVVRRKTSGRPRVQVSLSEAGRDVLKQSGHTDTDSRIIGVLTKRERDRFAQFLLKVRRSALQDLGIPEWQLENPLEPGNGGGEGAA